MDRAGLRKGRGVSEQIVKINESWRAQGSIKNVTLFHRLHKEF